MRSIGFMLTTLGAMMGESDNLLIPLAVMAVGGVLMLLPQRGANDV